ncbi:bifunctional glycoside hydrolase 114/ polysaccharide deacetylase family protein [Burkholderia sp. FERM BP-3421]|uniref:bifunctional glycoside hydrolase 114/ polysaccharide deacetylase family protein n=1 Tax=Burkholderia sp. FERM BP-3421 TaxID=1494466 RepID=UPI00235DF3A8|nr:bifunctional glycoside hydrolase 114/ polysaccharide deacetylase family protein [Burkholderia sp. FERM BP-3421]WDD92532.1 bifunctional glycoside hydrolase 114/ polysaccharide deacetylase family protein [Burkholderia sp. FERM BP-3421]
MTRRRRCSVADPCPPRSSGYLERRCISAAGRRARAGAVWLIACAFAWLGLTAARPAWADEAPSPAQPSFALYYGAQPPVELLSAYDVAVVEPDSGFDPRAHVLPHTTWFAYASVGEVQPSRAYYADLPKSWLLGSNEAWASRVVDQSRPEWPAFFVEHVIRPLWDKGYRGFFLDTLDAWQLAAHTDDARARQQAGLVAVIRAIHARYPEAKLIFNRGFEILPAVHGLVYAVAFESLYRGWNQARQRYTAVPEADRAWLLAQARTIRTQYNVPVVSIDYCPPADRTCASDAITRIHADGLVPFVTDGALATMGRGASAPLPRRILVVQDPPARTDLNVSPGVRYLAMPLGYLGYLVDYADARAPLPAGPLADRYAGIVLWLDNDVPRGRAYREWLGAQIDADVPIAMLASFGTPLDAPFARKLDLEVVDGIPAGARLDVASYDPALMGFEMKPRADPHDYTAVRVGARSRSLLRLRAGGVEIDGAALTPWGGYVMRPFGVYQLGGINQARWVTQPLAFLRAALRLPDDMPVPDTTTGNGRRLLMSHIDGDGFASRAEFAQAGLPENPAVPLYSGDMLYRLLRDSGMPTTASLIEGEVSDDGPYRAFSPHLRALGAKIFALPNVEVATHTYTHPLQWMRVTGLGVSDDKDTVTEGGGGAHASGLSIDIPGYRFNYEREVGGSIDYLNRTVAPAAKPVRMVLWSGDCQVPSPVLKAAYRAGVLNMNGGDTLITKSYPSWTAIAPLGVMKDGYYQVFAPNQNEELYTDLWHGPFYGFTRVLETFEMTDRPLRFKPMDIYYHMFSGTKLASMKALELIFKAVLAQPVMPLFASDYARKVLDSLDMSVARDGDAWVVRGGGALRTVRLPAGKAPDLRGATGVAGYAPGPGGTYVHLTGAAARFTVVDAARAPHVPYLADANGELEHFERSARGFSFDLRSTVAPRFRVADAGACRVSQRPLSSTAYRLHVDVVCDR